jgi:hypothetical protein
MHLSSSFCLFADQLASTKKVHVMLLMGIQ